jgi:TRAP transporter TAXI family solute receptor
MVKNLRKGWSVFLFSLVLTFSLGVLNFSTSHAAGPVKLPDTMLWSCYDVGSTGYVHASAMADALLKKYGTRVRLMPSGTSIGRLMPLKAKRVEVGWLATEANFAAEGIYDFAAYEWGPQDVRVILALPTAHAVIVTKESGIKTLKDLKGKRVSWIPGNPSLNVKMEAYLAFANLTWDDVKKVEFPSYGATGKGLKGWR